MTMLIFFGAPGAGDAAETAGFTVGAGFAAAAAAAPPLPASACDGGFPVAAPGAPVGTLAAAATAPDGLLWLGTTNKGSSGKVVPSDDRVIRIQPPAGGGESRQ